MTLEVTIPDSKGTNEMRPRVEHDIPATTYVLPYGDEERRRLSTQHRMLKYIFDGRLILAPVSLEPGDKILDCGTGTGIWLQELAMELPKTITLEGIDAENKHFPPPGTLPHENINFSVASVTSLPAHWTNNFAFVHQRLLILGLTHEDWPIALKEMYRVLKPGGWVELCEITTFDGGEVNAKAWNFVVLAMDKIGIFFNCGRHLPEMLTKAGFVNIHYDVRKQPVGQWGGKLGIDNRDNISDVLKAVKKHALSSGGFGIVNSEQDYDKLLEDARREWDDNPGLTTVPWVVCYAQKPLGPPN